jgi:hypothetical protein
MGNKSRKLLSIAILLLLSTASIVYSQQQTFGNFSSPGPIGSGTPSTGAFTTLSTTGQITSTLSTGTAPFSITSTTPVTNLNVSNHSKIQFCGTTTACSATALTGSQIVFGSAPLSSGTPSTAVITGISPAFTSSTSYKCIAADVTAITSNVVAVTYASGSSFTISGPTTVTDTVEYICAGN